jgi:uncharacterized protein
MHLISKNALEKTYLIAIFISKREGKGMKRDMESDLLRWKDQERRMPILVRGARQVGKTYIVEKFGKEYFEHFAILNFEQHPEYKGCFESLDPLKIINAIELITGATIQAGKTLLFLDEIQECPQAIMALRYFKEQMPDLHVIGAGSLLEFTLNDPNFRMPVGRVQSIYLRPLSFGEYLDASGNARLRKFLREFPPEMKIEEVVHQHLLSLVREYFALGGMPAVISEYLQSKKLLLCQDIQTAILTTFRNDFGKYAGRTPHIHLQTIFSKAPGLIGKWLKYSTLDPDIASVTLKNALYKLSDAGLIIPVYATSGAGLPFITHRNEKKCKLLFLDIGLVQRACNLGLELLFKEDLLLINDGALYSWVREEKNSSAEVDYLVAVQGSIIPIEVKAGAIGSLRSLKLFLTERNISLGVRISEAPFSLSHSVLSIPFYLIEELPRLVRFATS